MYKTKKRKKSDLKRDFAYLKDLLGFYSRDAPIGQLRLSWYSRLHTSKGLLDEYGDSSYQYSFVSLLDTDIPHENLLNINNDLYIVERNRDRLY